MEFIVKKTNELTLDEKMQICKLFEEVFGQKTSLELFEREFLNSPKGYSYHGLMIDENKIVGTYSSIPIEYKYFDKKYTFAIPVDTMISEDYRGNLFNLVKMANLVYDDLKKDLIPFSFTPPNENIYNVRKKILKWQDIGSLNYYILPINAFFIGKNPFFNTVVRIFSNILLLFANILGKISSKKNKERNISIYEDGKFKNWRYFDDEIKKIETSYGYCHYRVRNFKQSFTGAYIIDVSPLNQYNLAYFVKEIYKKEKDNADLIIYAGNIDFIPLNLIKIPDRLNPRPYKVIGKILIESMLDERVFNLKNWNMSFLNFDLH